MAKCRTSGIPSSASPDGGLYAEELFGEEGFSGVYSLLYHQYPPTRVSGIKRSGSVDVCREWQQETHRHHHLKTRRRWRPAAIPSPDAS